MLFHRLGGKNRLEEAESSEGERERERDIYTRQDSRRGFREILKARLSLVAVGKKALSAADARKRR